MKACHSPHQPSLLVSSTIGSGTSPQSRTSQGKFESRWLRVEWKALVSFPTLNERLSIFKELFAQFCAEVMLQTLANFRVHRTHFLTRQCATPISICQSICEGLFTCAKFLDGLFSNRLIVK